MYFYFAILFFVIYLPYAELRRRKQDLNRRKIVVNYYHKGLPLTIKKEEAIDFFKTNARVKRNIYLETRKQLKKRKIRPVQDETGTITYERTKQHPGTK